MRRNYIKNLQYSKTVFS